MTPAASGQPPWRTAFHDTTRDTLIRDLEGSADIATVSTRLSGDRILVRVTTRRPLSPRLTYTLRLHPLGQGAEQAEPLTVPFRRFRCTEPLANGTCDGRDLEVSVPLAVLGDPSALLVGADSRLGRVPIDRACWRLIRLPAPVFGPRLAPS
jgi:hypothetical protein